ncbi:hypothetical protein [Anaerostipes sp. PC18]|uniref:hypothetical protein n=1 Tax=Anaerostipes sp. PC18 TaxID=3036926 RepID=UPI0030902452|nr:hypothetical protein P8F77_02135 [Anaerostipes sp. PC18]
MTYTYDKVGNRLAEDKGDTKTTYDYNGLDQVKTSTTWKDGTVQENKQYVYDKNGNEIGQTNGTTGEILYRTYDAENRLTEFSVNKDGKNAVVQQNRYNGDGQRIQRGKEIRRPTTIIRMAWSLIRPMEKESRRLRIFWELTGM